jgi:hypothetical protein
MKEYTNKYKFDQGLRPYGDVGSDSPGLKECYNVVPRRGKLYGHLSLPSVPGITMDWPFPQLFCLSGGNYLCGRDYIKKLDSNLNVISQSGELPYYEITGASWEVVDFWQYVLFINGAARYVTDIMGDAIIPYTDQYIPTLGKLCNFKGQLVGAMPGENAIITGVIGGAVMDYDTRDTPRLEQQRIPLSWQGSVTRILRLGDRLMVYGTGGVNAFEIAKNEVIPAFKKIDTLPSSLQNLGVIAAEGDTTKHCLIDETGTIWTVSGDLEVKELGYSEFIIPLLGGNVRISYDTRSLFRDFYISDGETSYMLTEHGLCRVGQIVSSIQLYRGEAFATFASDGFTSWNVRTDLLDMGVRSKKTSEWIEVAGKNLQYCKVHSDGYSTPQIPFSPDGRTRAKMHGSDFEIELLGDKFSGVILEELAYKWKFVDKSTTRGSYADKNLTRSA